MIVVTVARKPLSEKNVAENVLEHGCGAMSIDGARIACEGGSPSAQRRAGAPPTGIPTGSGWRTRSDCALYAEPRSGESLGRWPANLLLSEEAADHLDEEVGYGDEGGVSRYFHIVHIVKK